MTFERPGRFPRPGLSRFRAAAGRPGGAIIRAMSTPATTVCPSCKAQASGNFCSTCGAALAGAHCASCRAPLTPGAKYCHRCGTPVGAAGPAAATGAPNEKGFGAALPWAVSAIALVALIALVAGQRFAGTRQAGADASAAGALPEGGPVRAPDISQMTPEERASRLFDRVMALSERGRKDSVAMFAPMAINAYLMLGTLGPDERYDLGRIAVVSGDQATARAQSDTILATHPTHLLGLLLGADAANMRGDAATERTYLRRFSQAAAAEKAKNLPEYQQHAAEIDSRLASAPK